jgi:8-oxo-dGTP pyrophosphatase MutT (NUDIX family)
MHPPFKDSKKRTFTFFGAAFFLRPSQPDQRILAQNYDVKKIAECARKNPSEWECLLMKRNYLDFAWDCIGGHSNPGEFPAQTMTREVSEEVGWKIKECHEICRQWEQGILKGFVYLVIPTEKDFMKDNPPRVPCEEVQTVAYFNLVTILESDMFKSNVKGRVQSFLSQHSDFTLQ